jgi:peptidyl-tRNA hydrolase, PTH2 family
MPLIRTTDILAAVISVASAAAGYVYGVSRGQRKPHDQPTKTEELDEDGSGSDEDSVADGDLSAVQPGFMKPCKLVRCFYFDLSRHNRALN